MPEWLRRRADLTPERLALVAPEGRLSYRELDRRVDAAAEALAGPGTARGDRLALLLRNGTPFVVLVHAAARLGCELVLLNTRLTPDELSWQIDDAGARLLVYDRPNGAAADALAASRPALRGARAEELLNAPTQEASHAAPHPSDRALTPSLSQRERGRESSANPPVGPPADAAFNLQHHPLRGYPTFNPSGQIDLDSVQSIVYTSGTTGRPKGARLTYGNHWWSATGSALNLGLREDDRWLACLPLFHVGGLAILLRSAIYGIAAVVHASFDERAVNRAIDEERVTIVSVVAAMLQRMLDARGDAPYPPWLRCVLLGGGPAPRPLLERCAERGVPVVQTYGLTESASQVATLAPEEALRKLGSAGKPLFPTELRVDAAPGQVGEILARGPTISPGYVNQPPRGEGVWLLTGDLGRLDDDGYLYVVDRRDDLIISGGENVYPAEVEAALLAHPEVAEAGVAGIADPTWGQVVFAAVVLRAGSRATAEELRAHCRARLAGYKVPSRLRLVEALPRNAAGKLVRRRLVEP
jgi:O-succinylbenzoic acid--CoA ligase